MEIHVAARTPMDGGSVDFVREFRFNGWEGVALTCEEDEAEHEPHVPPRGFEHGCEGSAEDAAEYVNAVGVFVLCKIRARLCCMRHREVVAINITGRFNVISMSIVCVSRCSFSVRQLGFCIELNRNAIVLLYQERAREDVVEVLVIMNLSYVADIVIRVGSHSCNLPIHRQHTEMQVIVS
jgi:hypothetical protein